MEKLRYGLANDFSNGRSFYKTLLKVSIHFIPNLYDREDFVCDYITRMLIEEEKYDSLIEYPCNLTKNNRFMGKVCLEFKSFCIDRFRKSKRINETTYLNLEEANRDVLFCMSRKIWPEIISETPEEILTKREIQKNLEEGISNLEEKHQQVLSLYYERGFKRSKISKILKISVKNIDSILWYTTKRKFRRLKKLSLLVD